MPESSSTPRRSAQDTVRMLRRASAGASKQLRSASLQTIEDMQKLTPQQVLKEALKAALVWLIIYLFLFVVLLGYKWQTKEYYESAPTQRPPKIDDLAQHSDALQSLLEQFDTILKKKSDELSQLEDHQTSLKEKQKSLEKFDFTSAKAIKDTATIRLGTVNLSNLLNFASLRDVKNHSELFSKAMKDLNALIDLKLIDWQAVDDVLTREYPDRQDSTSGVSCGSTTIVPTDTARFSHLENIMQGVTELLDARIIVEGQFYPLSDDVLLPSSEMAVQRSLESSTASLIQALVKEAAKGTSDQQQTQGECMSEANALMLVEEGLTALLRKADLRNVLRAKAMKLDPSAKSIILDADLPLSTPQIPEPTTLQLRRIIDKPILFEIIDWIDKVVEAGGGYSDTLDNYLDTLAGNARTSIGELFMDKLLEKSETIELPHPKPMLEKLKQYL